MKPLYPLVAVLILIQSCGDPDNTPTPQNTQQYTVNGLAAITMPNNSEKIFNVEVAHTAGEQKQVSLTMLNLPGNVTAAFSAQSGTPTFGSIITVTALGAAAGNYTPELSVKDNSGNEKKFPFDLTIEAAADCRNDLAGSYSVTPNNCSFQDYFTVTVDPDNSDRIIIDGIWGAARPGDNIYAIVDCINNTLEIPSQTANSVPNRMSGSGKITTEGLELTFKTDSGSDCTATFKK